MHVGWLSLDAERWQTRSVRRKQRSTLVESTSATPISSSIAALAAAALAAAALAAALAAAAVTAAIAAALAEYAAVIEIDLNELKEGVTA